MMIFCLFECYSPFELFENFKSIYIHKCMIHLYTKGIHSTQMHAQFLQMESGRPQGRNTSPLSSHPSLQHTPLTYIKGHNRQ